MAFKMKFSGFKKTNDYDTEPLKEGEFKPYMGTGPIIGGAGKLFKTFSKIAKSRAMQSKAIQKILEKGGKTFKDSPKSPSRGNFFGPKS